MNKIKDILLCFWHTINYRPIGLILIFAALGLAASSSVLASNKTENNVDYTSDDLALAVGFSANYEGETASVDQRISLYATSNGSDMTYLGETGISGRDPRILYTNGVFYMTTTKGGSNKGGYTFNVFKSTDLLNWTDDYTYPYSYRYEVSTALNNKYGLTTNTWGPKWVTIDDKLFMIVYTSRFEEDGSRLYFVNARKLDVQNISYDKSIKVKSLTEKQESDLGVVRGILVKESAVLDNNGRAQYVNDTNTVVYTRDSEGNLYNTNGLKLDPIGKDDGVYNDTTNNCTIDVRRDKNLSCDNGTNWTKLTLKTEKSAYVKNGAYIQVDYSKSFDTTSTSNYPIFDAFISEVKLGTESEQQDLNSQNLQFTGFQKMNFDITGAETYYDKHSILPALIEKSSNKYVTLAKTDPYGSIQRWVSDSITGPYYQIDDRFYPESYTEKDGNYTSNTTANTNDTHCDSLVLDTTHSGRPSTAITLPEENIVFSGHYEGTSIESFGGKTYVYSDHYNAGSHVKADSSNLSLAEKRRKYFGEYYSVLQSNNLANTEVHLRYSTFTKVNVNNTTLRPSSMVNNVLRNIDVFRPNDTNDMARFKETLQNAAQFNLNATIFETTDKSKVIAVVKSNRAIHEDTNADWYQNGWRYISNLSKDSKASKLNPELVKQFRTFGSSTPFNSNEIYLYKVLDKYPTEDVILTVNDGNGNQKTTAIITKYIKPSELNGKKVLFDGDSIAHGSYALGKTSAPRWSYANYIEENYNIKMTNVAVGGSRYYYPNGINTCQKDLNVCKVIPMHLTDEILNTKYDYIILEGGTNDLHGSYHNGDKVSYEQELRKYLDKIITNPNWANAKIGFVIIPHANYSVKSTRIPEEDAEFWQIIQRICNEYSISVINFFKINENDNFEVPDGFDWNFMQTIVKNVSDVGTFDGSHPSKASHEILGEYIAEWMTKLPNRGQTSPEPIEDHPELASPIMIEDPEPEKQKYEPAKPEPKKEPIQVDPEPEPEPEPTKEPVTSEPEPEQKPVSEPEPEPIQEPETPKPELELDPIQEPETPESKPEPEPIQEPETPEPELKPEPIQEPETSKSEPEPTKEPVASEPEPEQKAVSEPESEPESDNQKISSPQLIIVSEEHSNTDQSIASPDTGRATESHDGSEAFVSALSIIITALLSVLSFKIWKKEQLKRYS